MLFRICLILLTLFGIKLKEIRHALLIRYLKVIISIRKVDVKFNVIINKFSKIENRRSVIKANKGSDKGNSRNNETLLLQ